MTTPNDTEFKELATALKAKVGEVDAFITKGQAEFVEHGKTSKEALEASKKATEELVSMAARVVELEQKAAEDVKRGTETLETLGMTFAKSEKLREFANGMVAKVSMESAVSAHAFYKNTIVNADATTAPDRQPGIIPGAFRQLKLRDLVPVGQTSLNVIETTRELAFTNNAAETAEGSAKPESDVTFELVTTNIRTIAHWLKMSKQVIADAPTVASYVDLRLAFGVEKRIDSQIINGDGNSPNLSGMTKSGNYTAFSPTTGESGIDSIARTLAAIEGSDYSGSGILLNPADFWAIRRLKGTTNDHYLYGDPTSVGQFTLWGIPVITSNALTAGKVIVADFQQAYFYWNRQGTIVQMFEQDDDNVQKNLVTLRGEARGALETRVPAAARYGNLTA